MNPFRGIWAWLTSRRVRQAVDLHRYVRRRLKIERDRLTPETITDLRHRLETLNLALTRNAGAEALTAHMVGLREAAKPLGALHPHRFFESIEILVVATVLIFGFRTFAVQPMRIPTGSMEPTLHGVRVRDLRNDASAEIPGWLGRWVDRVVFGRTYYHIRARVDGSLTMIGAPRPLAPWLGWLPQFQRQDFQVGSEQYTLWLPPTELPNPFPVNTNYALFALGGLVPGHWYRQGEDLLKVVIEAGDHVLVDRLTYNFRRPRRGEIIVFRTSGVPGVREATHYMKRLVGLGGERVRIGNDRHVVIDGKRLDATTPGFERIYDFTGPPLEGEYSGHVNDLVARWYRVPRGTLAPKFPDERREYWVRPGHYWVLGDNTMNSLDGRLWGDFRAELVTGRFWMVYWPINDRFGWSVR